MPVTDLCEHAAIQSYLLHHLREAKKEVHFGSIGRRADIACEKEKIVWEIQCSPIQIQEIQARNRDYGRLGFQVVWIFHMKRFCRPLYAPLLLYLQDTPHYFSDMTKSSLGNVFDRLDKALTPIDVGQKRAALFFAPLFLPLRLRQRWVNWRLYFKGDFLDLAQNEPQKIDPLVMPLKAQRLYVSCKRLFRC